MGSSRYSADKLNLGSRCYRLTEKGRACVDVVESEQQTIGSLSRYLHDVLMMCGSGMWFEQLRQFMPPRSLDESLQALLGLGLIEMVEAVPPAPFIRRPASAAARQPEARYQSLAQLPV